MSYFSGFPKMRHTLKSLKMSCFSGFGSVKNTIINYCTIINWARIENKKFDYEPF